MTVPAVGLFRGFGKEAFREPGAEAAFQLAEGVGADAPEGLGGAGAHGSQAAKPGRKEGSLHERRYIYRLIDTSATLFPCLKQRK